MLAGDLNVLFNHGVLLITVWCSHARYTQQTCFYRAAGYWHRISEILAAQSDNTSSSPCCRSVSLPAGSLCGDPEVGDGGRTVSPPPAPGINIQSVDCTFYGSLKSIKLTLCLVYPHISHINE